MTCQNDKHLEASRPEPLQIQMKYSGMLLAIYTRVDCFVSDSNRKGREMERNVRV